MFTPLRLAVKSGHQDVTQILIDTQANVDSVDAKPRTLMYLACESKNVR